MINSGYGWNSMAGGLGHVMFVAFFWAQTIHVEFWCDKSLISISDISGCSQVIPNACNVDALHHVDAGHCHHDLILQWRQAQESDGYFRQRGRIRMVQPLGEQRQGGSVH